MEGSMLTGRKDASVAGPCVQWQFLPDRLMQAESDTPRHGVKATLWSRIAKL
jgi:hypothetical protein